VPNIPRRVMFSPGGPGRLGGRGSAEATSGRGGDARLGSKVGGASGRCMVIGVDGEVETKAGLPPSGASGGPSARCLR
jgi:hypothetical protein